MDLTDHLTSYKPISCYLEVDLSLGSFFLLNQ